MYREVNDETVFRKFWADEKQNSPRYFNDSGDTWHCSEADFLEFCSKMWKVYLVDDHTLVYIEANGEVHLSILRGADTSALTTDLVKMRNEVLQKLPVLWGWVGSKNRGIRKLMESIGFTDSGFCMWYGESHSRVLEWHCFTVSRQQFYISRPQLL